MAAVVVAALGRDAELLSRRVEAARRAVDNFCVLCEEYVKHPIASKSDEAINTYFRRWFQVYLAVADETMVLMTGRLCRPYQVDEHKRLYAQLPSNGNADISAIHSRGKEALLFKNAESLSRCSVDGFNYEYRKVIGKKGYERYEDQLDVWSSSVESSSGEIDSLVKRAQSAFAGALQRVLGPEGTGASQVALNDFRHLGESFSFLLATESSEAAALRSKRGQKDSLLSSFRFDREIEIASTKYSRYINLASRDVLNGELAVLKNLPQTGHKRPRGAVPRVIVDSDDEDAPKKSGDRDLAGGDVSFQPRLKRLQPSAGEQCLITSTEASRPVDSALASDAISILQIKRQLCANPEALEAHLDAVESEHNWENKTEAYMRVDLARDTSKQLIPGEIVSYENIPSASAEMKSCDEDSASLGKKLLDQQLLRCRVIRSNEGIDRGVSSTSKLLEFELSYNWVSGTVQRSLCGPHGTTVTYESTSVGGIPSIAASSVLDITFQLLHAEQPLSGPEQTTDCLWMPAHLSVTTDTLKVLLRDGEYFTPSREKVVKVDIMCSRIPSAVEPAVVRLLRIMKELQLENSERFRQRILLPPLFCLRKFIACLSKCTLAGSNSIPQVHISFRDVLALSLHPKFVTISCGDSHNIVSLQQKYIECMIRSIKTIPEVRCSVELSRLENSAGSLLQSMKACCDVKARSIGLCGRSLVQEFLKLCYETQEDFADFTVESLDLSCNRSFCLLDITDTIPLLNSTWKQRYDSYLIPAVPQLDTSILSSCILDASLKILLQMPALISLDLSYCWTSSADAIQLCNTVARAARFRVASKHLPPLDELRLLGLASIVTSADLEALIRIFEESGGVKSVRND